MDEHAPYAYTPPGGYQLTPGFAAASPPKRAKPLLKWGVAIVGLAVVAAGTVLGLHALSVHKAQFRKAERQLTGAQFDTAIQRESTTLTDVDCPNPPNRAGYSFDCSATMVGRSSPIVVRVTLSDNQGHFVWVPNPQAASSPAA